MTADATLARLARQLEVISGNNTRLDGIITVQYYGIGSVCQLYHIAECHRGIYGKKV